MQLRFSALAFAALVLVLSACVADDTADTTVPTSETSVTEASTTTSTDATTTSSTTESSTTTTTTTPPRAGGELIACESPEGYSIRYPASWSTNSGDVVPECGQFHPDPFEVPISDERVAAITVYIDPVRFADVVTPVDETELERAATAVDGLQAVRLEYETDGGGLWPEGTPITTYAIDVSSGVDDEPATMFVDTIGLTPFDYETNQVILDRMARSIDIDMEGVDDNANIVATYLGGGGGFSVVAEADDSEACLRIPPNGEPICTALPAADQLHTIQLTDLEPVLAGITGRDVFAVTGHLRDGGTSTVVPVPIDDHGVGGFSFTSDLSAFKSFTLTDITGEELRTVTPGG